MAIARAIGQWYDGCDSVARIPRGGNEGNTVAFFEPYRTYIQVVQIIIAVTLTICILLQVRGAGLGSVFGGTGTVFKTRRGIDRIVFRMTIAFAILFALVSFLASAIPAGS